MSLIKIPRNIFQTWETKNISIELNLLCQSWRENNTKYAYFLFDDNERKEFIKKHFDEKIYKSYCKIIPGAFKADLWRYCALYIYGGNFTISKANLSVSGFAVQECSSFSTARMTFTVSGFQGGDTGSLTTFIGTTVPPDPAQAPAQAPVSTDDATFSNAVSAVTGANPITVSNGTPFAALYLCSNTGGLQYWVQVTGNALNAINYNASGFVGPVDQQCGS